MMDVSKPLCVGKQDQDLGVDRDMFTLNLRQNQSKIKTIGTHPPGNTGLNTKLPWGA